MNHNRYPLPIEEKQHLVEEVRGNSHQVRAESYLRAEAISHFTVALDAYDIHREMQPKREHANGLEAAREQVEKAFSDLRDTFSYYCNRLSALGETTAQTIYNGVQTQVGIEGYQSTPSVIALGPLDDSTQVPHLDLKSARQYMKSHASPEVYNFFNRMVEVVKASDQLLKKLEEKKGISPVGKRSHLEFFHEIDREISHIAEAGYYAAEDYSIDSESSSGHRGRGANRRSIGEQLRGFFHVGKAHGSRSR